MRFRLFRSRAFWFGVPGLVFLLWGWWVARSHESGVGFWGPRFCGIGQMGGRVYAYWHSTGFPDWQNFYFWHWEMTMEDASKTMKVRANSEDRSPAFRHVSVSYCWLVASYGVAWAGVVGWRSRKYRPLQELR